jgi:hypothetical protein
MDGGWVSTTSSLHHSMIAQWRSQLSEEKGVYSNTYLVPYLEHILELLVRTRAELLVYQSIAKSATTNFFFFLLLLQQSTILKNFML